MQSDKRQTNTEYRDMEQNKGKGNDTLENGWDDYCKTTIETGRINPICNIDYVTFLSSSSSTLKSVEVSGDWIISC